MNKYYDQQLSAERLRHCYALAPNRVQQYLDAELAHLLGLIEPTDSVLELGCGYGRILEALAEKAQSVVGIDTSQSSLFVAQGAVLPLTNCHVLCMDAGHLAFGDEEFDLVCCVQNGLSAFQIDPVDLLRESLRVTKRGGTVVLSTYAQQFWEPRLAWFQCQAEAGLIGEIDYEKTGDGLIVCQDGFIATTFSKEDLVTLTAHFDVQVAITEVDESSLFCEMTKR